MFPLVIDVFVISVPLSHLRCHSLVSSMHALVISSI
jgi:hypothetical protein